MKIPCIRARSTRCRTGIGPVDPDISYFLRLLRHIMSLIIQWIHFFSQLLPHFRLNSYRLTHRTSKSETYWRRSDPKKQLQLTQLVVVDFSLFFNTIFFYFRMIYIKNNKNHLHTSHYFYREGIRKKWFNHRSVEQHRLRTIHLLPSSFQHLFLHFMWIKKILWLLNNV